MRTTSLPKTWIFFFVIVVILAVAALLQPSTRSQRHEPPSQTAKENSIPETREENAASMLKNGNSSIYLRDQLSGQSKIEVGYAVFEKPGFVVVRENNQGVPGEILGTSPLLSGRTDHVSVKLSRILQPNQVYFAELALDDGNGLFDEQKDSLANDKNKAVILMSFLALPNLVSTVQ